MEDKNLKEEHTKQSEVLVKPMISIPDFGSLTINEIMDSADNFSFDKKKNKFIAQKKDGDSIIGISITRVDKGNIVSTSNFEILDSKGDYDKSVKSLLSQGYTQSEIALLLGISQGYVSRLANS